MKELTISVSEKMYNEIQSLKDQGIDFDKLLESEIKKMYTAFNQSPDEFIAEFIKKFNEYENKFQAENGIN